MKNIYEPFLDFITGVVSILAIGVWVPLVTIIIYVDDSFWYILYAVLIYSIISMIFYIYYSNKYSYIRKYDANLARKQIKDFTLYTNRLQLLKNNIENGLK